MSDRRLLQQNVAVLYSESTREAYVAEAQARGEIYRFTNAASEQRHWLKGPYAYLAPNAAITILHRFNVKHDLIKEDEVEELFLDAYRLLVIPNAGHLEDTTIQSINRWLTHPDGEHRRLIVTGLTNLPPELLGLSECVRIDPTGYTGWRFLPGSPFADANRWEEYYLSSYRGYPAQLATAAPGARVLAELWEYKGQTTSASNATKHRLGDGIVRTERTLFVANQTLEYIGGAIQAQMNVDEVRDWHHPTHYLDTIVYLLRELIIELGLDDLFSTQLRSFGTYEGMVVLRHDADVLPEEPIDLAMLEWQRDNQIPATYVVLDPDVSYEFSSPTISNTWVEEASKTNLLEVGLHNDSYVGSPPTHITGQALFEHLRSGDHRLGITSYTIGRHSSFHRQPETLDAMEYLYDRAPDLLGMCTFSVLVVIEYDAVDSELIVMGRAVSYSTRFHADGWASGAVPGWWFPYHVVTSTVEARRTLRGWDSTKESEANYARIDELLAGANSSRGDGGTRLPNPVITVQYHPQNGRKATVDGGSGSLPWVQYLCLAAERNGYGIATKRTVYERLNDYESLLFRTGPDGEIAIANPTMRTIRGVMVRAAAPVRSVIAGDVACIHIVDDACFTLPPIEGGATLRIRPGQEAGELPRISQPNRKLLEIVSALHHLASSCSIVSVRAISRSTLLISNLPAGRWYLIRTSGHDERPWRQRANDKGLLVIPIRAPEHSTVAMRIEVEPSRD